MVNVIVWAHLASRRRKALPNATLLARGLEDLSPMLSGLDAASRDFR